MRHRPRSLKEFAGNAKRMASNSTTVTLFPKVRFCYSRHELSERAGMVIVIVWQASVALHMLVRIYNFPRTIEVLATPSMIDDGLLHVLVALVNP